MEETLKVYRVYSGYIAFCNVHRIVIARNEYEALTIAKNTNFTHGNVGFSAQYVCDAVLNTIESTDYEG